MYLHKYFAFQLKDWPPDKDFSSYLLDHFDDLKKWIPLKLYTLRKGHFNLASAMPSFFARPQPGPKMYRQRSLFISVGALHLVNNLKV